ncbi:MAG: glycosyltransferase family 2 protein [Elusimicrobia bacterium]|nr:glycosyltransferase family 2 protein [Elusimicrobiota bacterium]
MKSLSAVLITFNEEQDLPACLESLAGVASEIVVVDSASTDKTQEIAARGNAKLSVRAFTDYADQKQAALERATGEWVLSIDADERLSAELASEIKALLSGDPPASGYEIPYAVHFMGQRMRFGGLGCERHVRLFRRTSGRFVGGELHEGLEVSGSIGRLEGRMVHVPYRDLGDYLSKLDRYTTLAAQKRYAQGRRFSPLHHLLPLWELFVRLVLRLGVLDGTPGVAWWGLASFHTWTKFLKLREMGRTGAER